MQPFAEFPPDEIATIRACFDPLVTALGPTGGYGIHCYQVRLAGIWNIMTDPWFLDPVEDIIGPEIIC